MQETERFLAAVDEGQDPEALAALLDGIEQDGGPVAAIACVDAWIEKLQLALVPGQEVQARYRTLAGLELRAAEAAADTEARMPHWERALDIYTKVLGDERGTAEVAAILLAEAPVVPDVDDLLEAAGGPTMLLDALRKAARAPQVKGTERQLGYREALIGLSERFGDKDRAFLESLKLLRAAPSRAASVDEAVRLAMETERFTELTAVLGELSDAEDLSDAARAQICTKLGVLYERGLDDQDAARDAFLKALAIDNKSKAARRHAIRLSNALGLPPPAPTPSQEGPAEPPPYEEVDTAAGDDEDQSTWEQSRDEDQAAPGPAPVAVSFPSVEDETEIDRRQPAPAPTEQDSESPWDESAGAHPVSKSEEDGPVVPADVSMPMRAAPDEALTPAPSAAAIETTLTPAPTFSSGPSLEDARSLSDDGGVFADEPSTPTPTPTPVPTIPATSLPPSAPPGAPEPDSLETTVPGAPLPALLEQATPSLVDQVSDESSLPQGEATPLLADRASGPSEKARAYADERDDEPGADTATSVDDSVPSAPTTDDARPRSRKSQRAAAPVVEEPAPAEPAAEPAPETAVAAIPVAEIASAEPAGPPPPGMDEAADAFSLDEPTGPARPLVSVTAEAQVTSSSSSSSDSSSSDSSSSSDESPVSGEEAPGAAPAEPLSLDDPTAAFSPDDDEEETIRSPAPEIELSARGALVAADAHASPLAQEPFDHSQADEEATTPAWPPSEGALRPEVAAAFSDEDAAVPLTWAQDDSVASAERLALYGRALELQASQLGTLSEDAQRGFVRLSPDHPELSLVWGRRLYDAAPAAVVQGVPDFWILIARVQDDVDDVFSFLAPIAAEDEIVARYLDDRLADGGRDGLRLDLARRRLAHLTGARREGPLRVVARLSDDLRERQAVFEELAVTLRLRDEEVLAGAVEVFSQSPPDERARVYGRIVRHLPAPRAHGVWEQLLSDRDALSDAVGKEQAAKALLDFDAHHKAALDVLVELTDRPGPDAAEHETWLRRRMQVAVTDRDEDTRRALFNRLHDLLTRRGAHDEALEALRAEVRTHPDHEGPREALLSHLLETAEVAEAVSILDEAARRAPAEERAPFWVRAATLSRDRLKKRKRAQAFLDRALELSPHHIPALLLRAELAVDVGDPAGALQPLERLAAHTADKKERAQIHHRIGVLLEEHLLRAPDALRRYEVAAELDSTNLQAWISLRDLAARQGEGAAQGRALRGLAAASPPGPAQAEAFVALAAFESEQGQAAAAAAAYAGAVRAAPDDPALLTAWLAQASAVHGEQDPTWAKPSRGFLDEVGPLLDEADLSAAPFEVRRLRALCRADRGDGRARNDFSALLDERPQDPVALSHILRLDSESTPGDRRRDLLERYLVHHGDNLTADERARLWGDLAVARAAEHDDEGARLAIGKAATQAVREGADALSPAALDLGLHIFRDDNDDDVRHRVRFLQARAKHKDSRGAARDLTEAGRLAHGRLSDRGLARALYEEASALDNDAKEPRERMVELDIDEGKTEDVLTSLDELLARIGGGPEASALHVEKAALFRKLGDEARAADELRRSIDEDPTNARALDMAEAVFTAQTDARGLENLYLTQLKLLSNTDTEGRVSLLERLSQVRRYDLRDLRGAAEALEAIAAQDKGAVKAREDAARIYAEIGALNQATDKWREVLALDPFSPDAWRALLNLMRRADRPDGVFVVLAAMCASDLASDGHRAAHRNTRPPFPQWPTPAKDMSDVHRRLAHPDVRTPIRTVLTLLSDILVRELGPTFEAGRPKVAEHRLPRSVQQALRAAQALVGVDGEILLVESAHDDGFHPVHAARPTLAVGAQVMKGGMTPTRAFDLGRATGSLSSYGRVVAATDPETLKQALLALVAAYATREADVPVHDQKLASRLRRSVDAALAQAGDDGRRRVEDAVRQYAHARQKLPINHFVRGVEYTGHRTGLLLCSDILMATQRLRATEKNARRLVTELISFSIGSDYLALRERLGLALSPEAGAQLLAADPRTKDREQP